MLGGARDLGVFRARQKSLDRDREKWLNRCRVKYRLRPKDERSNSVFAVINTEYTHAEKRLPELDRPEDQKEFLNIKKASSEKARFALHAFDLKKEPEFEASGRRLFELEKELENQK